MEVGILARNRLRLLPDQAGLALKRLEMKLDELGGTVILHKPVGVDAKAILAMSANHCWMGSCSKTYDMTEATGDARPSHGPEEGV